MTRRLAALMLLLSISSACGSSSSEPTTTTQAAPTATAAPTTTVATTAAPALSAREVAPFHAIPADPAVVSGTATCDISTMGGVDPEGGTGWLVVCELDMSDPRVSGTERHDRLRFFEGGEIGIVWVAEEAVITNAEGTWRGSVQAADDGIPSGEAHYVGEGAYEGLEFHYYFGGHDSAAGSDVRGWISGGGG